MSQSDTIQIDKWTVSRKDYDRYVLHLKRRLEMRDNRPIEVRERERTRLHDKLLDSVPDDDRYDFKNALERFIEDILGPMYSYSVGMADYTPILGPALGYDPESCPFCDKPDHGRTACASAPDWKCAKCDGPHKTSRCPFGR